jgi:hypothetical protein
MSNLVCPLEEQASPVREIELTNEQLVAAFGACNHCCHHKSSNSNCCHHKNYSCHKSTSVSCSSDRHVEASETFHECIEFSFKLSIKLEVDEEIDDDWDDWDL